MSPNNRQQTPAANPAQTNSQQSATPPAAPASSDPATPPAKPAEPASFMDDEPAAPAKPDDKPADPNFSATDDIEEIEYDLELADDSLISDEEFDAFVEEAKKNGMRKEEAEARLKFMDDSYKKAKDRYVRSEGTKLHSELIQDEFFNSPEKQKAAKENINKVYEAYKDPDFMKFVKGNPLVGNNKHFVKFMAKLGASLGPSNEVPPSSNNGNPSVPQAEVKGPTLESLYGSHFEQK